MDLSMVPYGDGGVSVRPGVSVKRELEGGGGGEKSGGGDGVKYGECMRNHAAVIGGHAFDGCGEFMAGGENGSIEALKCAACGCHRNFHRKNGFPFPAVNFSPRPLLVWPDKAKAAPAKIPFISQRPPPQAQAPSPLLPHHMTYQGEWRRKGSETPPTPPQQMVVQQYERGRERKRQRTKFTQVQKERMQAFAERVGWKIQKHDDAELQDFCQEVGVERHVLKVWMHNNKNTFAAAAAATAAAKQETSSAPPIRV